MESAAQQAEAEGALPALFAKIVDLERLDDDGYFDAESGSTLWVDDLYLYPLKITGPARAGINSAVDQLRTVRLVVESGNMPWIALFSLLRSAIETAASSIWLLESDDRDVRMLRLLQLEYGDISDAEKMMHNLGGTINPPRDTREEWIQRSLDRRPGIGQRSDVAKKVTSTSKVEIAQHVVREGTDWDGRPDGLILALWQGFSGLIHGRPYAMKVILDREELGYNEITGSIEFRLTTGARSLLSTLNVILDLMDMAVQLYGRRSRQWQALPQDTIDLAAAGHTPHGTERAETT